MPYFVKSQGASPLKRGPFETKDEADRKRDELRINGLYEGQELYVEYQPFTEPERRTPFKPHRKKVRPRGSRSSSRRGGRSSGGGSSPKPRQKRRGKRRPSRRSGRRS